eukprot:COSAG01_NODE_69638_length_260_cov_57.751553_1_plen_65_part_10
MGCSIITYQQVRSIITTGAFCGPGPGRAARARPHAPIALLARHPKVSESQNGARSTFASFDRLDK